MHIDVRMWRVDLQRRRAIRKKGIFQRGWNLPIRAKGNNARCWMRTQSTNKQTLLRVGNCEWLSHGWYINFCPDCGSSNQSYSKIKAKSMQLQNTFNGHLLTLLLASCDHLWVISKMFWVSGCWSHNFVQPGKCNYRGKLYEEGELLLLNRGCKEWWAIQL